MQETRQNGKTCPWARESKLMLQKWGSRDFSFFPCWLGQLDADPAEDHLCQSSRVRASESQGVWATVISIILRQWHHLQLQNFEIQIWAHKKLCFLPLQIFSSAHCQHGKCIDAIQWFLRGVLSQTFRYQTFFRVANIKNNFTIAHLENPNESKGKLPW